MSITRVICLKCGWRARNFENSPKDKSVFQCSNGACSNLNYTDGHREMNEANGYVRKTEFY